MTPLNLVIIFVAVVLLCVALPMAVLATRDCFRKP